MDIALKFIMERQIVRPKDLDEIGIPQVYLYRLLESGKVRRISRGLYEYAGREITENTTIAEVCKMFPESVVCLLSALQFYDITTQSPHKVWIALENSAWRPDTEKYPVRVVYMSGKALTEGVITRKIEGVEVKIYSLAKTIVDCFKFRNKVGLDVALEALGEVRRKKLVSSDDLWKYAKICRVAKVMRPYMEAIQLIKRQQPIS